MLKVLHTKGVGGLRAEKEGKEKKSKNKNHQMLKKKKKKKKKTPTKQKTKNNQLKSSDTGASLWMGALPSTGLRTLML